jgi:hypothetical protein
MAAHKVAAAFGALGFARSLAPLDGPHQSRFRALRRGKRNRVALAPHFESRISLQGVSDPDSHANPPYGAKLMPSHRDTTEEILFELRAGDATEDDQISRLMREGMSYTAATARLSCLPPLARATKAKRKLGLGLAAPLILRDLAPGPAGADDPIRATVQKGYGLGLNEREVGQLLVSEHQLSELQAALDVCRLWPAGAQNSRLPRAQ